MKIDLKTRFIGKSIRHAFLKHEKSVFPSAINHLEDMGWSFKRIHMYPLIYQVILSPEGKQLDAPKTSDTNQVEVKAQFYTDLKKALQKPKSSEKRVTSTDFRV